MWRPDSQLVVKNKSLSPLGTKLYFYAYSAKIKVLHWLPQMAALSRGCFLVQTIKTLLNMIRSQLRLASTTGFQCVKPLTCMSSFHIFSWSRSIQQSNNKESSQCLDTRKHWESASQVLGTRFATRSERLIWREKLEMAKFYCLRIDVKRVSWNWKMTGLEFRETRNMRAYAKIAFRTQTSEESSSDPKVKRQFSRVQHTPLKLKVHDE